MYPYYVAGSKSSSHIKGATMADCSYARCVQERRYIRRELAKWTKNMVHIVVCRCGRSDATTVPTTCLSLLVASLGGKWGQRAGKRAEGLLKTNLVVNGVQKDACRSRRDSPHFTAG
uniref:Uncharacterized protein n=1 Tax=Anopheles farauti TaxID=69004 RepID=A0A182QH20_9DIPT